MAFSSRETLYSPTSELRNPTTLFRNMVSDIRNSRELALQLATRDIRAQYRESFLGLLWAMAAPVGTTITFTLLQQQSILNVDTGEIPFPVFVLVGSISWTLFTDSFIGMLGEIRTSLSIMTKINLPREAFLIASILKLLFNVVLRVIPLVILMIFANITIANTALLTLVAMFTLILLGMTLALFLMPIVLLVQDIQRALQFAMQFAFFITPVIYPPPTDGVLGFLSSINPVTIPLTTAREALLDGSFTYLSGFLLYIPFLLVALVLGLVIYRVSLPFIIERHSA